MRLQEPPRVGQVRTKNNRPIAIALGIFVALTLLGILLAGLGAYKIFGTTAVFGIMVDAQGNPVTVQVYPELWIGLAIMYVFSISAVVAAVCIVQK